MNSLRNDETSLNILLIEDNPGDVFIIKNLLSSSGVKYAVTHTSRLGDAIILTKKHEFDVILLDLGLPDSIGLETLKKIQASEVIAPVVVMTGLDDEAIALASVREGAQDYLVKNNLTSDGIFRSIKYSIERKKIQEIQKKHAWQFSILSSATATINESNDIGAIYSNICRYIKELLNNVAVVVLEINNNDILYSSGEGIEPCFDEFKKVQALDFPKSIFQFNGYAKRLVDLFQDGKLHEIKGGISNLFRDTNHRQIFIEFEKKLDVNFTYAIGFARSNNVYGGVIIFRTIHVKNDDQKIIETIGNQVSLSILRRLVENDLKISEKRYRKLNEELEFKVQERTKDLAETNNLLRKREEEFRTLAENSPDSIVRLDTELKHLYVNPVARKIWGTNIVGKSWKESGFSEDFHTFWATQIKKVIRTSEIETIEHNYLSAEDESLHYLLSQIVPENDSNNKIMSLLIVSRDITEKKKAEEQLKKNAKDLKELNATKDKFFGIIAHDLRNPFSSLLGASEILSTNVRQYDIDSIETFSRLSYDAAKSCYALLENLLEWSRAQTGNLKYNPQEVKIGELIDENLSVLRTMALNKKITLTSKIAEDYSIYADRDMLKAILRNLLNNALKFTCVSGEVSVNATKENNNIMITVKDNGIGIPKKDIDKLFRIDIKYSKIGTSEERGTGLGLLLCKEFIEQHGGKIWVESTEGEGSEFKFTIPIRKGSGKV
jgi:PAS domain S-box-containing protein